MNDSLLEELLHEDESSTLDFKREQYPFSGASDEQKGELLKDILAFANAWRRTTAYVLVGVEEIKGGRSVPCGVTQHLNDNDLQQFVNSKTNRPVEFAYRAYNLGGVQLGIIEIPKQARPVYLRKAYGKLAAGAVYVRRGSSTDIAQPDELANMGAADAGLSEAQPSFEFEWADISQQTVLGQTISLQSVVLEPQLSPRSLMSREREFGLSYHMIGLDRPGECYYRKLIEYTYESYFLTPLGFCLRNTSAVAAQGVTVKSRISKLEGVRLHDWHGRPDKPSKHSFLSAISGMRPIAQQLRNDPDPIVRAYPSHWELIISFGLVLPRATVWSSDVVYVGADRATKLIFDAVLYAENLPMPQSVNLEVGFTPEIRPMSSSDLLDDDDE